MLRSQQQPRVLEYAPLPALENGPIMREILWLAGPVFLENLLHTLVGINDTYLASRLPQGAPPAMAAIGAISYILWLIGLIAGAIGTGSTAIIARAKGARHQRLANSVCGQSITAAILSGSAVAAVTILFAAPLADLTQLQGESYFFALYYIRVLAICVPFMVLMLSANACLRGAGDAITPAIAMIVVDSVNILFSFALTRGWFGLPVMGFRGIAIGTVIAYVAGGMLQFGVLVSGKGRLRLYLHRLRPHWTTLKRVLRIGLPSGAEGLLTWIAQFAIVIIIDHIDPTNILPAAHIVTVRLESFSFMTGFAVAIAAATVVGKSLGMRDPARAARAAHLSYFLGGGAMTIGGILFILLRHPLSYLLAEDPRIANLSATCLLITAFAQPAFAASLVYGGALRGAGDTFVVMIINLASIIGLRLTGVLIVTLVFGYGLPAVWIILASELTLRGLFVFARFLHGGWKKVEV